MTRKTLPVAVMLFGLGAGAAQAADLFDLTVNVTTPQTQSGSASFTSITNLINALQSQSLNNLVSSYTQTSAATATLNIRGMPATVSYPANSTALTLTVPSAGVNVTFNGTTRDDSQNQLKNFLLKNGSSLLTSILQSLVANSPIDPIAGNPNSLQNSSAHNDFAIGTGIGIASSEVPRAGTAMVSEPFLMTAGGDIGFASSGGITSTIVNLPFRFVIPLPDPRFAVTLDVPITYINTQGASTFMGSFGAALRVPVLDNWYLTPNVRFGAGGSIDLGAGALQYSGGLASRYDIYWNDLDITIGNGITIAKTAPLSIGSISVSYNLTNELFNNGAQVEGSLPYTIFGQPTSWQAYLIDTAVTGSKVYINHYDEIGVNVGTRTLMNTQNWDTLRVGAALTAGSRYTAFKLAFSARF